MLSRESSDYQWYRQRAASLHSKPILEYAATTATVSSSSELGSNSTISDESMASSRGAKEKSGGMNGNGADVGRASGVDKSFAAVAAAADEKQGDEEVKRTKKVAKPKSNGAPGYNIVEVDARDEDEGTTSGVPAVRVNGHKAGGAETDGKNGSHLPDRDGAKSNSIIYEQHDNGVGSVLTTVKPSEDFEASLKHSRETRPRSRSRNSRSTERMSEKEDKQDQLQSGRQPGKGWEESAIRWAPLNVPFKRRIQTLAVLWHTLSIALFLSLFFALMAFPPAWLILTPYLIVSFVLYDDPNDGRLARRSPFLKNLKIWSAFGEYYPAQLHKTVDLEPHRKYVFGYHPHGIISHGAFAAFATEALGFSVLFPGITNTLLTLETNFRIPFYRDYALAMGLASVSRESITNILSKGGTNGRGMGRAVTIVVGGARESLQAKPGTMKLILNERKGFIKQAIRTGADLVPVLAFGENDLYDQVDSNSHPYIRKLQMLIKKAMGFTLPLFHARGIFNYDTGLMPYRRPINIVVGRPIKVVQQGQITDEKGGDEGYVEQTYLDDLHAQYVEEVRRLWETHKDRFYADREGELIID